MSAVSSTSATARPGTTRSRPTCGCSRGRTQSCTCLKPRPPRPPRRHPSRAKNCGSAPWTRRPAASRLMPAPPPACPAPLRLYRVHEELLDRWGRDCLGPAASPSPRPPVAPASALHSPPLCSACKPHPALPFRSPAVTWLRGGGPLHQGDNRPEHCGGTPCWGQAAPFCHQLQWSPVFCFACLSPSPVPSRRLPALFSLLPTIPCLDLGMWTVTPP